MKLTIGRAPYILLCLVACGEHDGVKTVRDAGAEEGGEAGRAGSAGSSSRTSSQSAAGGGAGAAGSAIFPGLGLPTAGAAADDGCASCAGICFLGFCLETPPDARIVQPPGAALVYAAIDDAARRSALERRGAEVALLPSPNGKVDLLYVQVGEFFSDASWTRKRPGVWSPPLANEDVDAKLANGAWWPQHLPKADSYVAVWRNTRRTIRAISIYRSRH